MNPIEELKLEHEGIKVSLDVLAHLSWQLGNKCGNCEPRDLERLLDFFSTFVDTCHHEKEEELLFPALEEIGVSRDGGPIGVMLEEHDMGRSHVRGLREALQDHRAGEEAASERILLHADAFSKLLRRHIEQENQVLFQIAVDNLSSEKLSELEAGFERIESDRVGQGKHEMFHRMLEELQQKYCS
jgi:hemerythrin-like domain-containing protein